MRAANIRGSRAPRRLTPARPGVGSASPPARPTLDGSVANSFLDCGHAEAEDWRRAGFSRRSGAFLQRFAGRQCHGMLIQLPPRKTRCEAPDGPGGSAGGDEA